MSTFLVLCLPWHLLRGLGLDRPRSKEASKAESGSSSAKSAAATTPGKPKELLGARTQFRPEEAPELDWWSKLGL